MVTLAAPATLVHGSGPDKTAAGIRASAQRAAQTLALQTSPEATAQAVPRTLARTGKTSKRTSGGGSMMMVMGIVGTVAGLAGTYYVINPMKDQTHEQSTAAGIR